MNKENSILCLLAVFSIVLFQRSLAFSRYLYTFKQVISYPFSLDTHIPYSGEVNTVARLRHEGSFNQVLSVVPCNNSKENLSKEVTLFFEEALKGEKVEWQPFVKRVLPLLEDLPEYKTLYSDLQSVQNLHGIQPYKKYCIQRALKDHQETLCSLVGKESISYTEWMSIASAIKV